MSKVDRLKKGKNNEGSIDEIVFEFLRMKNGAFPKTLLGLVEGRKAKRLKGNCYGSVRIKEMNIIQKKHITDMLLLYIGIT